MEKKDSIEASEEISLADAYSEAFQNLTTAYSTLSSTLTATAADTTTMSNNMAFGTGTGNGYVATTATPNYGGNLYPYNTPNFEMIGPSYDPCPMGHVASEEDIEYIDGVVVGHCVTCNVRMQMNRVAGGMSLLRIQHLLGKVMSIDESTTQLEEFNLGEILGDFSDLRDLLEKDEFALRQTRKLFDLAGQVLSTKVSPE